MFIEEVLEAAEVLTEDGERKTVGVEYFEFGYDQSILHHRRDVVLSATFRLEPGEPARMREVIAANLTWRTKRHPPLDTEPSAGSIFQKIEGVGAGRLIEQCGLKGLTIGGAMVTHRHANIFINRGFLLVVAVGMTFVIVTGGIDLSVGSVMAFTGILCAKLLADGLPAVVVIPAMIGGGALIGLLIGVLVQYFDVQPFIASLAGLFLARGLAFVVSLSSIRVEDQAVLWLQSTRFRIGDWYITPTGIIALLIVVIGVLVMQWTRFGRTIYAIGGSEQSAHLMGLNVARTKGLPYVISGGGGGLARE